MANRIKIFISSPSDVSEERKIVDEVVTEINKGALAKDIDITCETFRWETDVIPKIPGESPQEEINRQTPEYDIYIGIIWKRFGTQADKANSGTEEEFDHALQKYKKVGKPWIIFYFKESLIPCLDDLEEIEQLKKVTQFKNKIKKEGIIAKFKNIDDFRNQLKKHIEHVIFELKNIKNDDKSNHFNEIMTEFKVFAERRNKNFRESEIFNKYIELNSTDHKKNPLGSLFDTVEELSKSSKRKPIAILADFGFGKTTFSEFYTYLKMVDWLKNPEKEKIIFQLKLNEYQSNSNIKEWICGYIRENFGINLKISDLMKNLNSNSIILVLDGFDEITNSGENEYSTVKDRTSRNLKEVLRICGNGSPVIITCRKTFLETELEEESLENFIRLEIDEFDKHKIINFSRKVCPEKWQEFTEIIFNEKNVELYELAKRPLFLDMMLKTFKDGKLRDINNQADLYESLSNSWLSNENIRDGIPHQLKKDVKKPLLGNLAFKMFLDNKNNSYDKKELQETIIEIWKTTTGDEIEKVDIDSILKDVINCSFLVLNNKNRYEFAHRSFMEYFVAKKLCDELENGDTKNYGERILYEEIFEFIAKIMSKGDKYKILTGVLENQNTNYIARINAIPPLRKQRNKGAIETLLNAHTNDKYAPIRFVCGYTLAIIKQNDSESREIFNSVTYRELVEKAYNNEKNALIRLRMALLISEDDKNGEYIELSPDYTFYKKDLDEVLEAKEIHNAFAKVLKVNREHEILIEEAIRIMTLYVYFYKEAQDFEDTLLEYIFKHGYNNKIPNIRRISLWTINKLELITKETNDKKKKDYKRASKEIVFSGMDDPNGYVREMAIIVFQKNKSNLVKIRKSNL